MADKPWPQPSSAQEPGAWPNPTSAEVPPERREPVERDEPIGREELQERQKGFPREPEIEYERSVIRIPFYLKGDAAEKRKVDVMAFDAFMRLVREAPTTNGLGYRQFEFRIDAWELTNTYSAGLDADVTFTLADTVQPKSLCVAQQRDKDYPALIVYSAIYDIYVGSERIVEKQPGVAYATPVREIPPRNVTVAFEKPFESEQFAFSAGTCEGMYAISRAEFEEGAAAARAIRGQR